MSRASCIYEGWVRHRRFAPAEHAFRYRIFLMYLDLAELDRVFAGRWLWSTDRLAVARFRREDHFGDPAVPLDHAVRDLVAERTGRRPAGPIRLLTHLRYFGYVFNPLSLYFCYDRSGDLLDAVVAEVSNTPWGERHCYVLAHNAGSERKRRYRHRKEFHVSPFLEMEMDYDWRLTVPGRTLTVHVANRRDGQRIFDATMALRRREITGTALAGVLARYPLMTARVVAAIHYQALRLWIKRVPFHPHPKHLDGQATRRLR